MRSPFQPWLTPIDRRRTIDRVRIQIWMSSCEAAIRSLVETFSMLETNDYATDAEADRAAPDDYTSSSRQRQAMVLLRLMKLSLSEVSAANGASVPALKVAMHRALDVLKLALGPK